MRRATELTELLKQRRFRTLLETRLTSQTADGLLQTSLAGAVLFNPEHHTSPAKVAVGFVVLLLPYSLIGPFAGVFLDRWRRQRVLAYGAALRAALVTGLALLIATHGPTGWGFALVALGALGVNRLYLAAMSASLPSVVATERLLLANAVTPTAGTVMTIVGGGVGLLIRAAGGSNALVALAAAVGFLAASLISMRLPSTILGPHPPSTAPLREQLAGVGRGMVAGARHLHQRPAAGHAMAVVVAQRFLFGIWSIMTLLLYRNDFHNSGALRAGLVGVGQAVTAAGIGLVLAAAVTPWITARVGIRHWIVAVTAGVAVSGLVLGAPFSMSLLLVSSFTLGFATQAAKVCADTLIQRGVDDSYRGRVFALYDTTANLSFILGSVAAAFVLPPNGQSIAALVAMTVGYLAIAITYAVTDARSETRSVTPHRVQQPI
jgi:MFS family permease